MQPTPTPPPHHGTLLREQLELLGLDTKRLAELVYKTENATRQWLTEKKFSKDKIALLYLVLDISPSIFGLPSDAFQTPFNQQRRQANLSFQHQVFAENDSNGARVYYDFVKNVIADMQQSIVIYNYLSRTPETAHVPCPESLLSKQRTYYEAIQEKIESNPNLAYHRFLLVHPSLDYTGATKEQTLARIIPLMSTSKFEHIWKCLSLQPERDVNIYVRRKVSHQFDFSVIDDRHLLLELDQRNAHQVAQPDVLQLFSKSSESRKDSIVDTYNSKLKAYLKEGQDSDAPTWKIERFDIQTVVITQYKELLQQLPKLIEEIQQDVQQLFPNEHSKSIRRGGFRLSLDRKIRKCNHLMTKMIHATEKAVIIKFIEAESGYQWIQQAKSELLNLSTQKAPSYQTAKTEALRTRASATAKAITEESEEAIAGYQSMASL